MAHSRSPLLAPLLATAVSAALLAGPALPHTALAQSNPGYFIPPAARPAHPAARAPRHRGREPALQPLPPVPQPSGPVAGPGAEEAPGPAAGPQMQLKLPPVPTLPAMTKGTPPPAPMIGVLGIPQIMRASTAAQEVEKIISERREKLNEDAQKEQMIWRQMQQSLASERSKLSAEQVRAREKELQDRITGAQKTFRDRNRIIQEAGQYGLAQIERILVAVIREVAESRGMNLVLHRAQVALNVNEFDITDQVTQQLNKVLPTVEVPAAGVEPPMVAASAPGAPAPGAKPEPGPRANTTLPGPRSGTGGKQ